MRTMSLTSEIPGGSVHGGAPSGAQADAAICVPELGGGGGAFQLFVEGDALFDTMISAIENAQCDIRMESYIFAADEIGARFVAALAAKARAGIAVRLHLDAFGAGQRNFQKFKLELEHSGVRFRWFRPFRARHPLRYLQRNHRKLLVVDGREAFLGGFNIRYLNSRRLHGETRRRDTHVRVSGSLATLAILHFDRLWQDGHQLPASAIPDDPKNMEALLVPSYSRHCQHRLACLHSGLIARARSHVYLTSPYFGPGNMVDQALQAAAIRGVDVRLLVPRRGDPVIAGWATKAAYARLLVSGVRIYEYLPRQLHAKTSVIDATWSIIGSANLDYLSLFVNQELVLLTREQTLTEQLQAQYMDDLAEAEEITFSIWRRRGWRARGLEAIGWAARQLL